jgi:predicted amidohydrolase YtcJ
MEGMAMKLPVKISLLSAALLLLYVVAVPFSPGDVLDPAPDTVFLNGKIVTVDKNFTVAEAVAIKDGKFVGVGTNEEIRKMAGPKSRTIDLAGKTVLPGFIDGHAHMDREGLKFLHPSLDGAKSVAEIVKIVEREVKTKKPGEWVVTMPIGDYPYYLDGPEALAEKRLPNRWDLDRVAPNNPVYIRGIWYYWRSKPPIVSVANSYALKLAGVTRASVPPHPGVEIGRDFATGEPNGIFLEWGVNDTVEFSLMKVVPRFSHKDRVEGLKKSMERYNAVGTTGVYEGHGISSETLRAYKELWEKGELTVRSGLVISPAWDAVPQAKIDEVLRDWAAYASGIGIGDDMLRLSGIWATVDNAPPIAIRRKERPYTAWAGYGVDQFLPPDRGSLQELIAAAAKANLRPNAITAAVPLLDAYLRAFEEINKSIPIKDRRFVVEHLSTVTEAQMDKIKELGVVVTVIPGSNIWKWGSESIKGVKDPNSFVPLKRYVEKGIPFVLSTDNVPIEPLHTLWVTVARKDRVTGQVIAPSQRLTREEALRAMTINGAYLTFEEDKKGSIEVGKLADLAVLDKDYLSVPEDEIQHIRVMMTVVGGKVVYERKAALSRVTR